MKGFMRASPGPSFTKGRSSRYFVDDRENSDQDDDRGGGREPQATTEVAVKEPAREDGVGNGQGSPLSPPPQADGESAHDNSRQSPGGVGRVGRGADGENAAQESNGSATQDAGDRPSGKTSSTPTSEGQSPTQDSGGSNRTPVQLERPERRESIEGPRPAADSGSLPPSALLGGGRESGGDDRSPSTGVNGDERQKYERHFQRTAESRAGHLRPSPFTGLLGYGPRDEPHTGFGTSADSGIAPLPLPLPRRAEPERIARERNPTLVYPKQIGKTAARWGRRSGKVRRRSKSVIQPPKLRLPRTQKVGTAGQRRDIPRWADRAPKLPGGRGPRTTSTRRRSRRG